MTRCCHSPAFQRAGSTCQSPRGVNAEQPSQIAHTACRCLGPWTQRRPHTPVPLVSCPTALWPPRQSTKTTQHSRAILFYWPIFQPRQHRGTQGNGPWHRGISHEMPAGGHHSQTAFHGEMSQGDQPHHSQTRQIGPPWAGSSTAHCLSPLPHGAAAPLHPPPDFSLPLCPSTACSISAHTAWCPHKRRLGPARFSSARTPAPSQDKARCLVIPTTPLAADQSSGSQKEELS